MADVFISYKREEITWAARVAQALSEEGFSAFYDLDDEGIHAGEEWDKRLEQELAAAKCCVVLWSPNSVQSANVRSEARRANTRGILVPAKIRACEAPIGLDALQEADLSQWRGDRADPQWRFLVDRGVARKVGRAGRPPQPPPPPPEPGLGQRQAEEPAKPGIVAWMRGYGRFLAPAGVLLVVLLLIWRPWIPEAAVEEAAPAEAAALDPAGPAALDARTTPASTSAPLVSNPSSLPDFALFRDCTDCPEMVVIPAGGFLMGSPANEAGREENEDDTSGPGGRQVNVSVPRFAISRFEVTKADYAAFVGATGRADPKVAGDTYCIWRSPRFAQSDRDPVACVNTTDAADYAAWLSRRSGGLYRLPSEAEWEYAARGGVTGAYPWGPNASHDFANYGKDACCGGLAVGRDQWVYTAPVGSFPANPFGLFDMHGNVWEWVEDCYRDNLSGQTAAAYTTSGCSLRVDRGGSWFNDPADLRSANRSGDTPANRYDNVGFRIARTL